MDSLIYTGFINDIPLLYLKEYPRYLESILKRIGKLENASSKDKKNTQIIQSHWNRIKQLIDNAYAGDEFTFLENEYRWMFEELRISLFTQELKTKAPVSIKRLDKLWGEYLKTD